MRTRLGRSDVGAKELSHGRLACLAAGDGEHKVNEFILMGSESMAIEREKHVHRHSAHALITIHERMVLPEMDGLFRQSLENVPVTFVRRLTCRFKALAMRCIPHGCND